MNKSEFTIGSVFYTNLGRFKWQCTDIGTRVIVAFRRDRVHRNEGPTLFEQDAEEAGWFNGPPYAVVEEVFDEYDQEGCTLTKEG